MSNKHNYSQYSNKNKKVENPKPVEPIESEVKPMVAEVEEVAAAPEVVEPEVQKSTIEMVEGAVVDCAKLNVREEPNIDAHIVCVLGVTSEIEINLSQSNDEWYKICTATGIEGYCMRKFIDVCL